MFVTAALRFLLPVLLALPAYSQLGAPLGRCGPQPHDVDWPANHLPEQGSSSQPTKTSAVDVVRLQRDAQELADLSASIHADVDRANRGLLSKDVIEKLKRVEKLSKQLRSELIH
jgi:hypothetical protein